ncbi:MAG: hypothetical protein HQL63_05020 [Magnetococcales bacterium]|nr:hypothetical protein [Magnetococcales bacterium]MBF0322258.1 hypothetical protein [Magnetococcales bacterium]
MKMFPAVVLAASLLVSGTVMAESLNAQREGGGGGKETVIQNTDIKTHGKTGTIEAKDKSVVKAATVEVGRGNTIQNSKISTSADTGTIKTSGQAEVNAGGVNIK